MLNIYPPLDCSEEMKLGIRKRTDLIVSAFDGVNNLAEWTNTTIMTVNLWLSQGFVSLNGAWRLHWIALNNGGDRFEWRASWLRPDVEWGSRGIPKGMPHPEISAFSTSQYHQIQRPVIVDSWLPESLIVRHQ